MAKIIDLDRHRMKLAGDPRADEPLGAPDLDTDPLAYFEVVWGPEVCGWNAVTVDMEAYRRGEEDLPLRPPQTTYEMELIIRHLRSIANDLARNHRMDDLVRPEDDL